MSGWGIRVFGLSAIAILVSRQSDAGQVETNLAESTFAGLTFRAIGPATMSGRVAALAVFERNPAVFYVGSAAGGLWKTVNNGTTWDVLFDSEPVSSIGDVAIAPDDPNLVWVGTGENNNKQISSWGNGVYKSTDGGKSWAHVGLADTHHIGRIVVDPLDHDVVYVAATGHLWGANEERGVFKTADGGKSWSKVLYIDPDTGATDLVIDPSNRNVLYAATYQRRRAVWGFNGGGPGSGIFKTVDRGRSWTKLTEGIPAGPLGRIGLHIYHRDPQVLYATIEHEAEAGVYRTDDAGRSWRKMSSNNPWPSYFSQIRIDPSDDHHIYLLAQRLHISSDGGKTWAINRSAIEEGLEFLSAPDEALHSDHHALWIDPANSSHLIVGNDGGVALSYDRGKTWDFIDNMDLGQFYAVGVDMEAPYGIYGGLEDNLAWGGPSATRSYLGIANGDWFIIGDGDGFTSFADPSDSRTIYTEWQNGRLLRVDRETNERKDIRPLPPTDAEEYRWDWHTPIELSPHDSNTVFAAAQFLFRSINRGQSWDVISPDLTAAIDRSRLSLMGVRDPSIKLSRHSELSTYSSIVSFSESPRKRGLYYTGADDGTVHVSRDGGKSWTNLTGRFPGLPLRTAVSRLVPSAFDEATVYASFDGHQQDDFHPYVFASTDYGQSWKPATEGLPEGHVVRCLAEDPRNPDVLYLGSEFGLFVSLERGRRWTRLSSNLPTVPIYDLAVHPRDNDLILATFGRSIWILDDLTPIQQAAQALRSEAYLFDLRPVVQFNPADDRFWLLGDRRFWGKNPTFGAAVSYYVKQAPKELKVEVLDGSGRLLRTLDRELPLHAGIQRVHWNLRYQPLPVPTGHRPADPPAEYFGSPQLRAHSFQQIDRPELDPMSGPFVLPGEYRVRLSVEGKEVGSKTVEVRPDPLMPIADTDRKTLHDTTLELHELQGRAGAAAERVESASEQMKAVQAMVAKAESPPESLTKELEELAGRLDALRQQLGLPVAPRQGEAGPARPPFRQRVGRLKHEIGASTSLPTAVQLRQREQARAELHQLREETESVVAAVERLFRAATGNSLEPARIEMRRKPLD